VLARVRSPRYTPSPEGPACVRRNSRQLGDPVEEWEQVLEHDRLEDEAARALQRGVSCAPRRLGASSAVVDGVGQAGEVDAEPLAERSPGRLPEVAIEEPAEVGFVDVSTPPWLPIS
jgi:hypothetical protein